MSISLADALRQVDLRGGCIYQCQVGRFRVEVRVEEAPSELLPTPLIERNIVKAAEVRGPIRAGRVYGWYFLPCCPECELSGSIVDLRQLHTVPRRVLELLSALGGRKARLQPYREHLAKHFADTFSRIGLPEPYQTEL